MNKYILATLAFLCLMSYGFSQKTVNDFQFVAVPEFYDFLHEKDQYQLNTYTKFLLNKYGFNAYFESELPNVKRCDGLYATLEGKPGFVYTRLTVVLKDCEGNEIFRGFTGSSKEKDYKRAYHEALRKAFESVKELYADQKDLVVSPNDNSSEAQEVNVQKMSDVIVEEDDSVTFGTGVKMNTEPSSEAFYSNNGSSFKLSETQQGFALWEIGDEVKLKGNLIYGKDGRYRFVDTSGNSFPAFFNDTEDLTIETSFSKLVFTKKDQ
jgi:hypothetical protein